jgi:hypothetical protein
MRQHPDFNIDSYRALRIDGIHQSGMGNEVQEELAQKNLDAVIHECRTMRDAPAPCDKIATGIKDACVECIRRAFPVKAGAL